MAPNPLSSTGATGAPRENALANLSSDYTLFLRLLTTQMQNQDPLSPMDSSQYTQQLAQYAQVEQSIQQTSALKDMATRLAAQDIVQASALIGRKAVYEGSFANLSPGEAAHWEWTLDRPAAIITATIIDASGQPVDRRTISPGASALDWGGSLADGSLAQPGNYALSLDARDVDGNAIPVTLQAGGRVESVLRDETGMLAVIAGTPIAAGRIVSLSL